MTTFDDVVSILKSYEKGQQEQCINLRREIDILRQEHVRKDEILIGLRSIEASLQADLKEKRNVIQAQSERIIELAAYRDELRAENTKLKLHVATDQNIVKRNLEMVTEIADLKERNKALEERCFALDSRVIQQKEEIDGLKFAMHKAGL